MRHQTLLWGVSPHHTHKYTTIKTYGLSNEFPRLEKWKACIHGGNFNSPLLIYRPHTASHGAVVSICFLSVCRTGLCRIWKFLLDGLIKNCRTCLLKTPRWGTSLYYEVYHPITPTSTQPSKHMDCPMNLQDWRSGRLASMVATSIPLCWFTGLIQPAMEQCSQSFSISLQDWTLQDLKISSWWVNQKL